MSLSAEWAVLRKGPILAAEKGSFSFCQHCRGVTVTLVMFSMLFSSGYKGLFEKRTFPGAFFFFKLKINV